MSRIVKLKEVQDDQLYLLRWDHLWWSDKEQGSLPIRGNNHDKARHFTGLELKTLFKIMRPGRFIIYPWPLQSDKETNMACGTYQISFIGGHEHHMCSSCHHLVDNHCPIEDQCRLTRRDCYWEPKENYMYIPNDDSKFFVIWKVRTNSNQKWICKEDCPGKIYNGDEWLDACKEAERLSIKHDCEFVVLQATTIFAPPPPPVKVVKRVLT